MNVIKALSFTVTIFAAFCTGAQNDSTTLYNTPLRSLKKMARSALMQDDAYDAARFMQVYVNRKPGDAAAYFLLGTAQMKQRDYARAERSFLKADSADPAHRTVARFLAGMMEKSLGQYDSARNSFLQFKSDYRGIRKDLKKQAVREAALCDSVKHLSRMRSRVIVRRLDTTINKVYSEASPMLLNDSTLLFCSYRTEKIEYETDNDTSSSVRTHMYSATRSGRSWSFSGDLPTVNDGDVHTVNGALSVDGQRMYFTKCAPRLNGKMGCSIWVTERDKRGDWSEPQRLGSTVNARHSSATMPAVTIDSAKGVDILYFVSDRMGGKGGLDIWYTIFDKKKGEFRKARNAGNVINSANDEITPWLESPHRIFFSSERPGGLGGFDVYVATAENKRWMSCANVGPPVNSGADDLYYRAAKRGGFFVSNRPGGNAVKNLTCCDDIYEFAPQVKQDRRNVLVKVVAPETGAPVPNATVSVYQPGMPSASLSAVTNSKGEATVPLSGDDYSVTAKAKDRLAATSVSIRNSSAEPIKLALPKKPKGPVAIDFVYYELNKFEVTHAIAAILDSTVLNLLLLNPGLIVEIGSHTDSRGSEESNLILSQNRAQKIVEYLVGKGIDRRRLRAQGYGESRPVAPNEKPDGTDNPEGRQKNRRTEFEIIGDLEK